MDEGNVSRRDTKAAWEKLTVECDADELYEEVGQVVLAVVGKANGRRSVSGFEISEFDRRIRAEEGLASDLERWSRSGIGRLLWPSGYPFPAQLRREAALLKVARSSLAEKFGEEPVDPVSLAEWNLLAFVHHKTGFPHFKSVSDLLKAACLCGLGKEYRKHAPSYSRDALRNRYRRFRDQQIPRLHKLRQSKT